MEKKELIIEQLKTVFDPEFPVVDVYTLGLIYDVEVDEPASHVKIVMTFTTPSCPLADQIERLVKSAVLEAVPDFEVEIEITFDPMWSMDKIKDPDLKRIFE